jgi:hypothetical protein
MGSGPGLGVACAIRFAEVGTGTSRDGQGMGKRPSLRLEVDELPSSSQSAIERQNLTMSALRILVPVKRVIDYAVSAQPS